MEQLIIALPTEVATQLRTTAKNLGIKPEDFMLAPFFAGPARGNRAARVTPGEQGRVLGILDLMAQVFE